MFFARAYSAVHLVRYAAFDTFTKKARFWSVGTVSYIKRSYSDSNYLCEKPTKVAKSKKNNEKKVEPSKLYPDEWEKLGTYDMAEHFSFMNDDYKKSSVEEKPNKLSQSGKQVNLSESVKTKVTADKCEADKEEILFSDVNEISEIVNDPDEYISQSDSDSDTEDNLNFVGGDKSEKGFSFSKVDTDDLHVNYLPRKSAIFRSEIQDIKLKKNRLTPISYAKGIFHLAKQGIVPKKLFFTNSKSLAPISGCLSDTTLYKVPYEDLKYWAPHAYRGGILAIYQIEDLRSFNLDEPDLPVTLICDGLKHKSSFGSIIYSASVFKPKAFLTSQDCTCPWGNIVMEKSSFAALSLNYSFNLTLDEIKDKIDFTDRVFVLQTELLNNVEMAKIVENPDWSRLRKMDLYETNFWEQRNIALILKGSNFGNKDDFINFCRERNAIRISVDSKRRMLPSVLFDIVYFEMRRQFVSAKYEKDQKGQLRKEKNVRVNSYRGNSEITIR